MASPDGGAIRTGQAAGAEADRVELEPGGILARLKIVPEKGCFSALDCSRGVSVGAFGLTIRQITYHVIL